MMALGLSLALAPGLARAGFALLIYGDAGRITAFGAEAVAYIALLHAVLGAVIFGWGVALLLVVRSLFARKAPAGWKIVAYSVVAWFIPDTAYSIWSGFWQNVGLNLALIALFVPPLAATYRAFHETRGEPD